MTWKTACIEIIRDSLMYHCYLGGKVLNSDLAFNIAEIYRIVSQKQITDGSSDGDKPGGSQTINLQPTVPDTKDKKACCN